jgi:hypothetical protein
MLFDCTIVAALTAQYRYRNVKNLLVYIYIFKGTAVAQWLRYCATNQKIAGSIPDGFIGIFH